MRELSTIKRCKIIFIVPSLDLTAPVGTVNALWQFLKGLYEVGCDVIVTNFLGNSNSTPWWSTQRNPCSTLSRFYLFLQRNFRGFRKSETGLIRNQIVPRVGRAIIRPSWKKHLGRLLIEHPDTTAVIFYTTPMNQLTGIPTYLRKSLDVPILFFDADLPFSLPEYGGFTFNHYIDADLSEYDLILGNCETALPRLEEMGAQKTAALHFAVDPDLYKPVSVPTQDIDIFFSALGARDRERWIKTLITKPSKEIQAKFVISGRWFNLDIGSAKLIPFLPLRVWRYYCARSKINLSITRESVANSIASNSRPFELASFECCIISNPNRGLSKWFDIGREMFVVNNEKETKELYVNLLDDAETRRAVGKRARERVLKEHTFKHRGAQLLELIAQLK